MTDHDLHNLLPFTKLTSHTPTYPESITSPLPP